MIGRAGLDLNLTLSYNSQATWTKTENGEGALAYTFDADRGSPAPGFRLGFPSIQGTFTNYQAQAGAYLLIAPSGGHVELRQVGNSNVYESVDSSYLQLLDGGNGSMLLRSPDGTQLSYWSINSEYRCTEIKDRNGNFITIKYDPINGTANLGRVTSVIDTLGRTINFNHDANFRLQSITQVRDSQTHVWASFGYSNLTVQTNFAYPCSPEEQGGVGVCGHAPVQGLPSNNRISVLTQVGLDDGSRTTFNYTSWGQIYRIRGLAADGHILGETRYDLPADDSVVQEDCPRFTERQDSAENWNDNQPVTTTFLSDGDGHGLFDEATYAAGTAIQVSYREYSTSDYGDWLRGLVTRTETRDAAYEIKKTTTTVWARDQSGLPYALNPRPKRTAIFDGDDVSGGNRKQTSYEYTSFGLVSDVFEQGPFNTSDWEILRRTHIDYDLSPTYVNRRILGLVTGQYVFAPDSPHSARVQKLMSKTTYEYDVDSGICTGICPEYALAALSPSIVQHDGENYGGSFMVGRGLQTQARRWDVTEEYNETTRLTSSAHYNSLGALIRTTDAANHATTIDYTDQFSVDGATIANPSVTTLAYPTKVTDAENFFSKVRYSYELGLATRTEDPKAAAQTTQYDGARRVTQVTNLVNQAYTRYLYPASQTLLIRRTSINDVTEAHNAFTLTVLDGAGRVRAKATDFPDVTPHYGASYTTYDVLGRAIKQYNPIEIAADWTATGPDNPSQGGFGWIFSAQTYDFKGRPLVTTNPDETTSEASYDSCGCAGGDVVALTDEGSLDNGVAKRRQRRIHHDVLGRTWKTENFIWQGEDVYSATVTSYNALDQITQVSQYKGEESPTADHQDTTMEYDGQGRLWKRHVPAQDTNAKTIYSYNNDDTVASMLDARGVSTTYTYDSRRLLTKIEFGGASGPGAPLPSGVAPSSTVQFSYDATGKRILMSDGLGHVDYDYNQLSQLLFENRFLDAVSNPASSDHGYKLSYTYNLAGQLQTITDPFGSTFTYGYDNIGRTESVSGTAYAGVTSYASNVKYRAWGAIKSADFGDGTSETVKYNQRLQASQFRLTGGSYTQMRDDYTYFADGRLRKVTDLDDVSATVHYMSRSYTYDHVGRTLSAGAFPHDTNFQSILWLRRIQQPDLSVGVIPVPGVTDRYINVQQQPAQWLDV